jgi:D-alanine-D-alanine ligase
MQKNNKHVVVMMGGLSSEREVSLSSGASVIKALNELGYRVTTLDPSYDVAVQLEKLKPDVVFNALHGTYGEDGVIPGILEMMRIPYTHSGVMASAVAFNKSKTKDIIINYGVRVAKGMRIKIDALKDIIASGSDPMPRPYVIKPNQQGSSIGVYIVHPNDKSPDLSSWNFGDDVVVEEYIPGKELSVAVFADKAIGALELRPRDGFYDYEAKYTDGVTDHIFPADVPASVYKQALESAEKVHNILGCRTMSRSDFRYDPSRGDEGLYFLEINTHPGFTNLSIVPEIAEKTGTSFKQLVERLLQDATCEIGEFKSSEGEELKMCVGG